MTPAAQRSSPWTTIGCWLLLGLLLAACGGDNFGVIARGNFDVRANLDQSWATLSDPDQFVKLDTSWHSLVRDGFVSADTLGQAEMCPTSQLSGGACPASEACHIYVFWSSELKYSSCQESASSALCVFDGSAVFRDCPVGVQTLSADVQGLGTWFSVTYLWESQMTIVVVFAGQVQVQPVTLLRFTPLERPAVDPNSDLPPRSEVKVLQREMGKPVTGEAERSLNEVRAFYTAPDDKLKELGLAGRLARPRSWLGPDELLSLRERLRTREPGLEGWLATVWQTAAQEGYLAPALPALAPERAGLVLTSYAPLDNLRFAQALSYAVDWPALSAKNLATRTAIALNGGNLFDGQHNLIPDARKSGYSPARAAEILKAIGVDRLVLPLVVPREQGQLASADWIKADLEQVGITAEIQILTAASLPEAIQAYSGKGVPFMILEYR